MKMNRRRIGEGLMASEPIGEAGSIRPLKAMSTA